MITIENKLQCCGCTACAQKCPKHCITMAPDAEGFLYPVVEEQSCVDCGLCERVCPIQNPCDRAAVAQAFGIQTRDEQIRQNSSAGGAFYTLACKILEEQGVVFGAAMDEQFVVRHCAAQTREELLPLCMSKYVQSELGDTFSQVQAYLKDGRKVLFVGTPCQCEGLLRYLGGGAENLVTMDFLCHGVPSPKVWKKYVDAMKEKYGANAFRFRSKAVGYRKSAVAFETADGRLEHAETSEDEDVRFMPRAFYGLFSSRPSCHACAFKGKARATDITLGDLWHIGRYAPDMDDDKGTTFVAVHTDKGRQLLESAFDCVRRVPVDVEAYLKDDGVNMICSMTPNPKRDEFLRNLETMTIPELSRTYLRQKQNPVKNLAKRILGAVGVLHLIQRAKYRFHTRRYVNSQK